jgi:hypothetical protein
VPRGYYCKLIQVEWVNYAVSNSEDEHDIGVGSVKTFAEFMQNLQKKRICMQHIKSPSKNRPFTHTEVLQRHCHLQVLF